MAKLTKWDHRTPAIDPKTGQLSTEMVRKLNEIIDRLNSLLS
jgi:hypothetical protein